MVKFIILKCLQAKAKELEEAESHKHSHSDRKQLSDYDEEHWQNNLNITDLFRK